MAVLYPDQFYSLYCFQHDVSFSSEEIYQKHMAECMDLLSKKNLCKYIESGQSMCASHFNTIPALIFHYFLEHGRYLCNNCTLSFLGLQELESHQHTVMKVS